jgi:hypothetical protein
MASIASAESEKGPIESATPKLQVDQKDKQPSQVSPADNALARLAAMKAQLPSLKKDLDELKQRGQDISYPMIRYTILENSNRLAEEDVKKNEIDRAFQQIDAMDDILARLKLELGEALAGRQRFPEVPRWTGDQRPTIKSSSFLAPVRMADGKREMRPVFFTGFGAFSQPVADIEKWPGYGTNIIEVQYGPGLVFPADGVTSDAPMREMQSILDRAQKAGVAVDLMLCPHYFPNWGWAKWPHLSKRREDFLKFCLHAPEGQELLRRHIAAMITPIANHPALHSVCLANEPTAVEEPCQPARDQWHTWLQEHHKDIKTLNVRYGSAYTSFDAVPLPDLYGPQPAMPLWMDFVRFNQEFMAQWHQMLADAVHKVAPSLPVHTKPIIDRVVVNTTWPSIGAKSGLDATLFSRFSNINGCDALMFYNWGQSEFANNWRVSLMGYDLLRSVLDAPVFNSENHPIPDRENRVVPASHMRCVLWQQAIHGQSATVFWVWQPSFGHGPKDELDGNTMYRPACTEAVGVVNCDLNRAAYEVTALQQAKPDVLLLQSVTASAWEPERYDQSLLQLYTALSFTGLKIGFVTERQLESGLVPSGPVVIIPNIAHLSNAAVASLGKYTGHFLMVGGDDVLAFDEYGHDRKERLHGERIEVAPGTTDTPKGLRTVLQAKLSDWNIRPAVDVRGEDHQPAWGVEWRSVKTDAGVVVNLCNYLNVPMRVSLNHTGHSASGRDLLTGQPVTDAIEMQPLEVRLLLVNRNAAAK